MSDPLFLTVEQIETLHKLALEQHGGQHGVRDRAALESAAAQPRNVFYYSGGDHFEVAAAYAFHLAEAQSFADGNKRVGMAAALVFLKLNGVTIDRATDKFHAAMIGIASHQISRSDLASLFRGLAPPASLL